MVIHVREQFVESKHPDRVCEDLIVVTEDFAAVIDGASDVTGLVFDGRTGGRFAADTIEASISQLAPTADARIFADSLSLALSDAVRATSGELDSDMRWPAASVACASAHRREVWRVGDCTAVIGGVEYTGGKRVDDAAYGFRAALNAALLKKGVPLDEIVQDDPGAQIARPLFDSQQHLANVVGPWGFGCINGRPVPDEYIDVMSISAGPSEVIITSDGYPVVLPTLAESEAALSNMIRMDPASIGDLWSIGKPTRPGAVAPDDRAYLRVVID